MIPRCFWDVVCITLLLLSLNTAGGCNIALDSRLKMISCACFLRSGLRIIFYWKAIHLSLPSRYSIQEQRYHGSQKKKDVSSANSPAFEDKPSDKSLINIKNNSRPSMEPWGTQSSQSETLPFSKSLCFLFLRKSHKRFSKLPDIPFLILKMRPSCQTLSPPSIYLEKRF